MPAREIHVLVVDDSAVVRQTVAAILRAQEDMRVTLAPDALFAIEKLSLDRPDVIVLDLEMPRMDGLTFLRRVMERDPLPVVICSGRVGRGSADAVRALREGAVELITKPQLDVRGFLQESAVILVDAVRAAAQTVLRPRKRRDAAPSSIEPRVARGNVAPRVIAVGASTGGTEAIRLLLGAMPADICGIAVVQHMPSPFTRYFAEQLNDACVIDVREATSGEELRRGVALVAPGDKHMEVRAAGGRLFVDLRDGPLVSRHRPSVDVLFHSVVRAAGPAALGVILTGMGADGAAGLLEMRRAGAATIAQDEESSVVFGMPREAIACGAAQEVLPLGAIAGAMMSRAAARSLASR